MLANSVPCERVFSSMNLIHTKLRNRLSLEKLFKLMYIHFNLRALRIAKVVEEEKEEDDLALEDQWLERRRQTLGKRKYEEE